MYARGSKKLRKIGEIANSRVKGGRRVPSKNCEKLERSCVGATFRQQGTQICRINVVQTGTQVTL